MNSPRRGEVWLVDLGMAAKVRPALVISILAEEIDRAFVTLVPHTTSPRHSRFEAAVSVSFLAPASESLSGESMDLDTLWLVADRARERPRLVPKDASFVRDIAPDQLDSFPGLKLPARVRHPAGFLISGASVGPFLRSALLVAGRKALGRRFGGSEFYERVEKDLAFGIMRSHFHHGYPKGVHCCVPCTLGDSGAGRRADSLLRLS